jgi:hypothetical protein
MADEGKTVVWDWASVTFQRRDHFGQKYDVAETLEELVSYLAEAVCAGSGSIAQALRTPRRHLWVLNLMRRLTPRRYARFLALKHEIWAEAIAFVAWKLREYLSLICFDEAWVVYEHAALRAGVIFVRADPSTPEERERFIQPLKEALGFYDEQPTLAEALQRLSFAGGRRPSESISIELLQKEQKELIFVLEPWAFVYRWERLPC